MDYKEERIYNLYHELLIAVKDYEDDKDITLSRYKAESAAAIQSYEPSLFNVPITSMTPDAGISAFCLEKKIRELTRAKEVLSLLKELFSIGR